MRRRSRVGFGAALVLLAGLAATPGLAAVRASSGAASGSASAPSVLHVGQIASQDVAPRGNCEPDTLAEPDVAVSPLNRNIQVAVAHDCRYGDGGAADISYSWTHDGGATWSHAPVPDLTRAVGGKWARASDPVVAFGPDGSVYISALVFDFGCATGVTVSKSTDGGATFAAPVLVQKSLTCAYSDDKNWLVVDTQPTSPYYGRLYQFWTVFLSTRKGEPIGSPQVVRWSSDGGATWSATHMLTARDENTQDSQPMIQPSGAISDAYFSSGESIGDGPEVAAIRSGHARDGVAADDTTPFVVRTSRDGGATWSREHVITPNVGFGAPRIRCCLPAATADPVSGTLYAVWDGNGPGEPVKLSASADGRNWSPPVLVTADRRATIRHVNAAVAAYNGKVFVSYGTLNTAVAGGRFVQQYVSSSFDGGRSFGQPLSLGPRSNLRYAARAPVAFPGDYIGAAETASRLTLVWCVSSRPSDPTARYHQVLYAAVLRP